MSINYTHPSQKPQANPARSFLAHEAQQDPISFIKSIFTEYQLKAWNSLYSYISLTDVYPSQERIACVAGVSLRTVNTMIAIAKRESLIHLCSNWDRTSYYYFNEIFYEMGIRKLFFKFMNQCRFFSKITHSKTCC